MNALTASATSVAARSTIRQLALISGMSLFAALVSACAVQDGYRSPEDAATTARVEAVLQQHRDLAPPNDVYVATRGHVVYLSGSVATSLQSEDAAALARGVPGVTAVVNSIASE